MPWKLLGFVALLVFATIFIGFNLEHRCDVSIGFTTFKDVPIFLSLLIAFALGVLVMTPFTFIRALSPPQKKMKKERDVELTKQPQKADTDSAKSKNQHDDTK
ncbi:MAG TPA: hypothetical protein VLZ44_04850 [Treponemataceae bacterium]|nr:hypothetical protein [Treponemataceae bacterium]HUH44481.1 hypothetical protein [Treponemataceae bacterium]